MTILHHDIALDIPATAHATTNHHAGHDTADTPDTDHHAAHDHPAPASVVFWPSWAKGLWYECYIIFCVSKMQCWSENICRNY